MIEIHYDVISKYFGALAHPLRIRIIEELKDGAVRRCLLAERLNVSKGYLSRHISILKQLHIISSYVSNSKTYYKLENKGFYELIEFVRKTVSQRYSEVLDSIQSTRNGG